MDSLEAIKALHDKNHQHKAPISHKYRNGNSKHPFVLQAYSESAISPEIFLPFLA